jgi:hypothetical protein
MCYLASEFVIGDSDVLLGDIDGGPFYIDARLGSARLGAGRTSCSTSPTGRPEGFSLPAGTDRHFVVRSRSCLRPDSQHVTVQPTAASNRTMVPSGEAIRRPSSVSAVWATWRCSTRE